MRITLVGFCIASLQAMTTYGVQLQAPTHAMSPRTEELMQLCGDYGCMVDALNGDWGCCGKPARNCKCSAVVAEEEQIKEDEKVRKVKQEMLDSELQGKTPPGAQAPEAVHYHIHPPAGKNSPQCVDQAQKKRDEEKKAAEDGKKKEEAMKAASQQALDDKIKGAIKAEKLKNSLKAAKTLTQTHQVDLSQGNTEADGEFIAMVQDKVGSMFRGGCPPPGGNGCSRNNYVNARNQSAAAGTEGQNPNVVNYHIYAPGECPQKDDTPAEKEKKEVAEKVKKDEADKKSADEDVKVAAAVKAWKATQVPKKK